jgi:cytoskeletal protein CcmA (bactofilin family)
VAQIIDLGKLRFVFKGTYSGSTAYELNDVVRYGGNLYVYKNTLEASGNLPTVTTHWDLMLEGIDFKGAYNNSTAYKIGDLVTEGAKGYICIADSTGNRPPNGTYWTTIVDGLQYEGEYAGGTTYQPGDVVSYGGSAYICILRSTGNTPTDTTYWNLFVDGAFPDQTNNSTKILTTNGTSTSWTDTPTLTTVTTRSDIIVNGDADIKGSVTATSRSINVTNKVIVANVATLTTDGTHYFDVGDRVSVSGVGAGYNGGGYAVTAVTSNTFSYATSTASDTSAAVSPAGTATVQGDISTTGKLDVTGVTTLTGALNANGGIIVDTNKFTVADTTGDVRTEGSLEVDTGSLIFVGDDAKAIAEDIGTNVKSTSLKARTSNVATITTSEAHGFSPFQFVTVNIGDATFDGEVEIIDTPTTLTFTYDSPGSNVSPTSASGSGLNVSAVTGFTNPMSVFTIEADDYAQLIVHNTSGSTDSSSDFIAYPDNGTDFSGYIDMGITSSTFADPEFTITGPNDGYIFMTAPIGSSGAGNLVLATGDTGSENKIVFAAGGLSSNNEQMSITPDENVHIEIATESTSASTGALTVVGGVGIQGDLNIAGNVAIVGTISFGGSGTTVTTNNLSVGEPMIFSGAGNQADLLDEGLVVEYATTVTAITNTVTNKALTSNVATLTTGTAHTYRAGDVVVVSSVDATFNGTYSIIAVPTSTTFTYAKTNANVTSAAVSPVGGTSVAARREFAGFVRDASDGVFKAFTKAVTKPTTTVDFAQAGIEFASARVNNATVGGTLAVTGAATFNGDVTVTGNLRIQELTEDVVDVALGGSPATTATFDYTLGSVFWITTTPGGAMTWNITNAPTTDGRTFTVTGFVTQGGTGYIPSTLTVNGSAVTIRWFGALTPTPTSTSGRIDIFNFTLIRRGGSYVALGNASPNFG